MKEIVTPVNFTVLQKLLEDVSYDRDKISKLVDGFTNGFDIRYQGDSKRKNVSCNLPFRVGNPTDMWNKIMKEVKLRRYTGPYEEANLPFEHYVQSPIGLVPKAGN